jgi:membrane-bound ClpP family serine protease
MGKKSGAHLRAFLLLADELIIALGIFLVLWKLGVPVPFPAYIVAAAACAAVYWFLYRVVLDQRRKSLVGCDSMVGLRGKCVTSLDPEGLVRVQGEIWRAVTRGGQVAEGAEVVVEAVRELRLVVRDESTP